MNIIVSIIVPNFNHQNFLNQRFKSILEQTYKNYEIIILDDASTDNSKITLDIYSKSKKVSHFIINDVNSGSPFLQWEKGIKLAKGKYIWIAESDDYCDSFFLEKMILMLESGLDLVYCRSVEVDVNGCKISDDYWPENLDTFKWKNNFIVNGIDEIKDSLLYRNTIPNASACIFRKSNISYDTKYLKMKFAGDWFFWINFLKNSKIGFCCLPLSYHRTHSNSTRGQKNLDLELKRFLEIFKSIKFAKKIGNQKSKFINKYNYEWLINHINKRNFNFIKRLLLLLYMPSYIRPLYYHDVYDCFKIRINVYINRLFNNIKF
ncbi:MAG: glycosyltransferase [Chitinophagaceae bacterium]|nr:glycosyltransferase [Chitinophagaceae bacterium]